jgi:hypothetical protein
VLQLVVLVLVYHFLKGAPNEQINFVLGAATLTLCLAGLVYLLLLSQKRLCMNFVA